MLDVQNAELAPHDHDLHRRFGGVDIRRIDRWCGGDELVRDRLAVIAGRLGRERTGRHRLRNRARLLRVTALLGVTALLRIALLGAIALLRRGVSLRLRRAERIRKPWLRRRGIGGRRRSRDLRAIRRCCSLRRSRLGLLRHVRADLDHDGRVAELQLIAGLEPRLVDSLPVDDRAGRRTEIDNVDLFGA